MNIKKWIVLSVLFLRAAIAMVFYFMRYPYFFSRKTQPVTTVRFPQIDMAVTAEVARDPYAWSRGLMFRELLPTNTGMLFIFPDEQPRSFWMKYTRIPLDILFISADKRIVSITRDAIPCKVFICPSYSSQEKAMYVLEVNAGFADQYNLSLGDQIVFEGENI